MKTADLLSLIKFQSDKNIKFKFLNTAIAEVTDLDWDNVISLSKEFCTDRMSVLYLCIACMRMLFMNEKKYIIIKQFISILEMTDGDKELKVYELLKSFFDCSMMKLKHVSTLLISNLISVREVKLKFLKEVVVELTIEQMNVILKQKSTSEILKIYELLVPFIKIPTNIQNSFKFIKFIFCDSQKIEYAKFLFDKIDSLPNADLYSILGSMQDDIFKVKFVELFADKIEISISNLLVIIKIIPTGSCGITKLFISNYCVVHCSQIVIEKKLFTMINNFV